MSEERNARKVQIGKVVSDKMDKTIVVAVETYKKHDLYHKRIKYTKNLKRMMRTIKLKSEIPLKSWKLVLSQRQALEIGRSG